MGQQELIACFQDTLTITRSDYLMKKTTSAVKSNRVYQEGFASKVRKRGENASVVVLNGTTFETARMYHGLGKVAVLNFANPEYPGGGVNLGAMAQEECLCRSSNLYPCISAQNVLDEYYYYHRNNGNQFYSDRLIYTKGVTVFKDDSTVPQLLPVNEWFDVDVITCAAPYLAKRKYTNGAALLLLLKSRIKNIFEAARDNRVDVIILGAFGCGAFKNSPLIVAEAFRQVICEQNYFEDFKQIVFAIKPTGDPCPNLTTFSGILDHYTLDKNQITPTQYDQRFCRKPALPTKIFDNEDEVFSIWQMGNRYFGKQFSVLGDSISTLEGYNPQGYKVFFCDDNCTRANVSQMSDTWWDKVIGFFGGELLVNNSWSGSRVTKLPGQDQVFPAGCSDERTSSLHINDVKPDVILVYLGTNDWAFGAKTGNDTAILGEEDSELFNRAYGNMLRKLKNNYPQSEIWCCTLCETYMSCNKDFHFPYTYGGTHIEEYNAIIRSLAAMYACGLIDLYSYKTPYDTIDGSHPNLSGMDTLATLIIKSMVGLKENKPMKCDNNNNENEISKECSIDDSQYVLLDSNTAAIIYSDILRLTIMNNGQVVQYRQKRIEVGRDILSDLKLQDTKISHKHATFTYERNMWFLQDNHSTNGTWINGVRILPDKKYQLAADDQISFAMTEKVTFYQQEQTERGTGDSEDRLIKYLEIYMSRFSESDYKDEYSLGQIFVALSKTPLYFPVTIDIEAVLGSVDPTTLKAGDRLQLKQDVPMRVLTLEAECGEECVPMFTSVDEVNKGPSTSTTRYYPQDYLPMLIKMNKSIIINPFSTTHLLMPMDMVEEYLLPLVQNQENTSTDKNKQQHHFVGKIVSKRYEVQRLIGRDSLCTTYLVKDIRYNKIWAMIVCDTTGKSYSSFIREQIIREPQMMMKMNHTAIPKIIDFWENDQGIFIVREYVEGVTLESVVNDHGAQPADKVVEWGKQLCDVLGYLHKLTPPHIYRDMKPVNVILTPYGQLKVIDFATVRLYDPMKSGDTVELGTKGYAAPEQYGGYGQTDERTDIYGLGMTMYRLVTGVDPCAPPYITFPICQINPNLPKGLEYIISKCTHANPADRYQNCDELMADLDNYMNLPKPKGIFGKLFNK